MFKFISHVFLLQVIIFYVHGGNPKDGKKETHPPIDQDLPLIMIKTRTRYEPPTRIEIRRTPLLQKKLHFVSFLHDKQTFFCPAESARQENAIDEANKFVTSNYPNENRVDKKCLFKLKIRGESFKTTLPKCKKPPQPAISKEITNEEPQNGQNDINMLSTENPHSSSTQDVKCGPDDSATSFLMGYPVCRMYRGPDRVAFFFYKTKHKGDLICIMRKLRRESKVSPWAHLSQRLLAKKSLNRKINTTITINLTPQIFGISLKAFPFNDILVVDQYKFCYNEKKQVVYTTHTAQPTLLTEPLLARQREATFDMQTFGYTAFGVEDFDAIRSKYERIENNCINGPKFNIQKLVPPDDFAFALYRKSTYHYANTNLMHQDLQPLWDHISDIIRKNIITFNKAYGVYTGAFKVSPPTAKHVHIVEGVQIPEIWVKVLHREYIESNDRKNIKNEAVAIIANNYLSKPVADLIDKHYCRENLCKDYDQKDFTQTLNHIRCCPLTKDLKALFGFKFQIHKTIRIDGFIRHSSMNRRLLKSDTTL